jgi:hypothetical protein
MISTLLPLEMCESICVYGCIWCFQFAYKVSNSFEQFVKSENSEVILCKSSQVFELLQQKVFEESQGVIGCMSLLPTKDPNIYELDYF